MTEARTVVAPEPALGFSYSINLDKEAMRGLVFQAHVPVSASVEQVNDLLDKMCIAANRQLAIAEVAKAERALVEHEAKAQEIEHQLATVEELSKARWAASGRKGEWTPEKLDARDKQEYLSAQASHRRWLEGAQMCKRDLERYKPLVNGHAPDSSADRHAR